jgi:hypothetical protein
MYYAREENVSGAVPKFPKYINKNGYILSGYDSVLSTSKYKI